MITNQKINVVKMKILLKLIYTFSTVPFKIPDDLFAETENLILKLPYTIYKY